MNGGDYWNSQAPELQASWATYLPRDLEQALPTFGARAASCHKLA